MIIFLSISLNMCFGCSKERLIETVLLSTHNMFWLRNKKTIFSYTLLSGGLHTLKILKDCKVSVCKLKCQFAEEKEQESPLIFGTHKSEVLWHYRHFMTLSTSLQMLPVCFILCKQAHLIEENISGQWAIRFAQCFIVHG